MSDTNLPAPDEPYPDADTIGHLAEDVGLDDEGLAAEAGIDPPDDPGGTPASGFQSD